MQIIDCEQGSDEWHGLRLGTPTASKFHLLTVDGKGERGFGVGAMTYMDELIGERITGESASTFDGNTHTERGHRLEDVALNLHCESNGIALRRTGIILNNGAAYSPDALLDADGLGEVKTKLPRLQIGVLLSGVIPKEHTDQCQGGLWMAEREWIDFISYWPGMPLFVRRAYRDEKRIAYIKERVVTFLEVMEERTERVLKSA